MDWETLERAVAEDDWTTARTTALEGWRVRRHPRFADVIDWIDRSDKRAAPFKAARDFHTAWLTCARAAEDIGPFTATLTKAVPESENANRWPAPPNAERHAAWIARVAVLVERDDDPRIAQALVEALALAPWPSWEDDWDPLLDPGFSVVARIGDPRSAARMHALLAKPVAKRMTMRRVLAEKMPAVIEAIEKLPDVLLAQDEAARVDRLIGAASEAAGSDDEDALFDLVRADLESDGPRAVLADHWLERGDPRGDFVTRQLAGEELKGTSRKLDKEWLGDLARVTFNRKYARGFLDEAALASNSAADPAVWEAAASVRDVGTLRRLDQGSAKDEYFRRFIESAPSLQVLAASSKRLGLELAARAAPWPVTKLELRFAMDAKTATTIATSAAFPRVTEVGILVKPGGTKKLMTTAAIFAAHGRRCLTGIVRGQFDFGELAEFLTSSIGDERKVDLYGYTLFAVRVVDAKTGALAVTVTSATLYGVDELVTALRKAKVPIAGVRFELPAGMKEPAAEKGPASIAALRGLELSFGDGWTR